MSRRNAECIIYDDKIRVNLLFPFEAWDLMQLLLLESLAVWNGMSLFSLHAVCIFDLV